MRPPTTRSGRPSPSPSRCRNDAVDQRRVGEIALHGQQALRELVLEEYWPDIDGLAHRETITDETISLGLPSGTFFDFAAIHLRGVHSFHDLDPISKLRFSAFQNRFFKNFEGMYYSRREGILTTDLWNEIDRTMSDFLAYDGVRQWWETRKHWHTEAFVRVVDGIIARNDKPTAYSAYDLQQVVLPKDS